MEEIRKKNSKAMEAKEGSAQCTHEASAFIMEEGQKKFKPSNPPMVIAVFWQSLCKANRQW